MQQLTVALLQLLPGKDLEDNLSIGIEACRTAGKMGADIALFPEMWSTGNHIPEDPELLSRSALTPESSFLNRFQSCAQECGLAIAATFLEHHLPRPRNTLHLFDRHGRRVLSYSKVHTCVFGPERALSAGAEFQTVQLDTVGGPVQVGAMICFDREFPESARILMLQGAEIVLVPNACPMEINRLSQLRGRAYENMMGIATCNYPAGVPDCNGHSSAFDGVAYLPDKPGSRDTCILEAAECPGIYLARFDLDLLRAYRRREVHGNAYRRPQLYHPLIAEEVREPFLRDS